MNTSARNYNRNRRSPRLKSPLIEREPAYREIHFGLFYANRRFFLQETNGFRILFFLFFKEVKKKEPKK